MKHILRLFVILLIIIVAFSCTKKDRADNTPLPFSDKVLRGKLDNGMQYFIRKNDLPSDRIELRLSIRSGSLNEEESERGIAHFVEHLAFNGTEHFKGNDFVKFFEEMGMSFGSDLNAYTSADETNYQLTVPTDKPELLEKSFLVMRDWAHAITFEEKEVLKERGVILAEWRQRNNANRRIFNEARKEIFANSMYVSRDPIGDVKILENTTKPLVEGYYKKWYVPENMAVIVAGNIEEEKAVELIKKYFADLSTKSVPERASRKIDVPKGVRVQVVSDPEAANSSASLFLYYDDKATETYAEKRNDFLTTHALSLFSRRAELAINEKKLDIISLSAGAELLGENKGIAYFDFTFDPNKFEASLRLALREVERAARFGFSENELSYLKKLELAKLEAMTKEDYKVQSAQIASSLSSYFIYGGSYMEATQKKEVVSKLYNETTLSDFNKAFDKVHNIEDMLLLVTVPERDLEKVRIDKEGFIKFLEEAKHEKLEKEAEVAFKTRLIEPSEDIISGKVLSDEIHPDTKDRIVTFENGAKLLLRKNAEEKLKYTFSAKKQGGTNILNDRDALLMPLALRVLQNSGFKNLSKRNLDNILADKLASTAPIADASTFGFLSSGLSADLETAFELLYKYLTAPYIDEAVLGADIEAEKVLLAQQANKKELQFNRKVYRQMYNENYRRNYLLSSDLDNVSASHLLKLYEDNFLDISNYIFVISGDFDSNKVVGLFAKYVASFPTSDSKAVSKDRMVLIEKNGEASEKGEVEDKTTINIYYMKQAEAKLDDKYKSYILQHIIDTRYREEIREELGGAYSVGCMVAFSNVYGSNLGQVFGRVTFPMDPRKEKLLVQKSKDILARLITHGVTDSEVETAKKIIETALRANYKNNMILSVALSKSLAFDEPIYTEDSVAAVVSSLTTKDINDFIKAYLKGAPTFISLFEPVKR